MIGILRYNGYHGTSKRASEQILSELRFDESTNGGKIEHKENKIIYHWLGRGVYFWNNEEMARFWVRHKNNGRVIKVSLECHEDHFLDLTQSSISKSMDEFISKYIEINPIKTIETLKDKENWLYPIVGYFVDYLLGKSDNKYKLVHYTFEIESSQKFLTRMTPQYCVKDQTIIKFDTIECYEIENKVCKVNFVKEKRRNKKTLTDIIA